MKIVKIVIAAVLFVAMATAVILTVVNGMIVTNGTASSSDVTSEVSNLQSDMSSEPTESSKPAQSSKPTESSKPAELSKPTESSKPTVSSRPAVSSDPVVPIRPPESSRPVVSVDPAAVVTVCGTEYPKSSTELDLSEANIEDVDELINELSEIPNLAVLSLYNDKLTLSDIIKIAESQPYLFIYCNVKIDGVTYDTRTTDYIDFGRKNLAESEGMKLVSVIGLFRGLKKADMCGCGYTNEQMEQFVNAYPETKFVWEIVLANRWTVRTDAVAFSTFQGYDIEHRLTSEEAQPLKYCTDLVALDLGHNNVTDLSFLQYMPNLKILILVDSMEGIIDGEWRYIKDLSMLKYCPNLVYLEYFCNQVTDLSFLQYLPNLVDLNLSWSPVSDYTYLKNLPNIERLYMMGTSIPHHHYLELCELYPDAQIERYGESSIDKGWREHPRYYAMRYTFLNNELHPMFQ